MKPLFVACYNLAHEHETLAMASGLRADVWTVKELIEQGSGMRRISINQVGLDEASRIHVTPQLTPHENYLHIYRAAMSVRWDKSRRSLYVIAPDLDQLASYKLILQVVADECGDQLVLSNTTSWSNTPDDIKGEIQRLNC
jgi:hypothetical protein